MILRRVPDDFRVSERLRTGVVHGIGTQAHHVYELTKRSLTTPAATAALARSLGINPALVARAGLKDKHAFTTQHLSVPVSALASAPARLDGDGWHATLIGSAALPLRAADILCNEFAIILRGLSADDIRRMDVAAKSLALGDAQDVRSRHGASPHPRLAFLNLFGGQRFVSARHGEGFAARSLIRGEFELALRLLLATPARKDSGPFRAFTRAAAANWGNWRLLAEQLPPLPQRRAVEHLAAAGAAAKPTTQSEQAAFRDAFTLLPAMDQQMCVEAYQSHLWNAAAVAMSKQIGTPVNPLWLNLELPMLAPTTRLREPWAGAVRGTLAAESLTLAELAIPGLRRPAFRESMRRLYVVAEEFNLSSQEHDEFAPAASTKPLKRTATFSLPSGAYATTLIEALCADDARDDERTNSCEESEHENAPDE